MIKNLIRQKEQILRLSLMNLKTLFIKKIPIKWEEFKAKNIIGKNEIDKIWSAFDDKRFVLNDGIHTLAYFHKDLKNTDKKELS